MSLKIAFATVLKVMRNSRGLTQQHMARTSSRTYMSKLERAQSSPTLDKLEVLSETLQLSPLTVVAMALGARSGESTRTLLDRLKTELGQLEQNGVLRELGMSAGIPAARSAVARSSRSTFRRLDQTEFQFAE